VSLSEPKSTSNCLRWEAIGSIEIHLGPETATNMSATGYLCNNEVLCGRFKVAREDLATWALCLAWNAMRTAVDDMFNNCKNMETIYTITM
jgi:hypothetical protein